MRTCASSGAYRAFIAFASTDFDDLIGMRTINVCPVVALLATLMACSSRTDAQSAPTAKAPPASRPVRDSEIIRSAGVPTDPDDTAHTRYGTHEAPRRIVSPECRPRGIALCLTDTAEIRFSVDCCIADQRQTKWLVFAARDDSLQLFLTRAFDSYLTMSPPNAARASSESALRVSASWLRARFPASGTYVYTASIEADTNAPYELRICAGRLDGRLAAHRDVRNTHPHWSASLADRCRSPSADAGGR